MKHLNFVASRIAILFTLGVVSLGLTTASLAQSAPKRVALLVGVGDYIDPNMRDLEGPPHDVAALRDVLVRRWGVAPQDVKTLTDHDATRANIMSELTALSRRSGANDEVIVYFSGHGTSALDSTARIPLPHGSGAFVPADFKLVAGADASGLIVGRTDMVPVFKALEAGGRRMWVISDSCYSGRQVRSAAFQAGELPERMIPMVFGKDAESKRADLALASSVPIDPYPYRATAFLSASTEGERAKDIPRSMLGKMPTLDGKPHGAMTDALLRVLEGQIPGDLDGDGFMSLNEVHRATADFMAQRAYGHTPMRLPEVSDDQQGLGNLPVLSMRSAASAPGNPTLKPFRVVVDGATPVISAAVSGVPDIRIVKAGESTDIVLLVKDGRVGVIAASGDPLAVIPATDVARVTAQVRQLAWANKLRGLAEKHRRGALEVEIDPAVKGGNFVPGDLISFAIRPDQQATIVVLNVNSLGKVGVLYPSQAFEAAPISARQVRHIPGKEKNQRVIVQEPFGMDMQFVFAFDEPPAGLSKMYRLDDVNPDDPRLLAFERTLSSMAGKFTFASTSLRTLKP